VLLVAGLYFKGGYAVEMQWRERVAELEAKVKESEEKAKEVNEKVVVEYRDRVKVVTETKIVIQEKIKEVEKIVDAQCKVAPEAVLIHNDAAKMPERNKK
jgi:preprotein translocase subunit SecF